MKRYLTLKNAFTALGLMAGAGTVALAAGEAEYVWRQYNSPQYSTRSAGEPELYRAVYTGYSYGVAGKSVMDLTTVQPAAGVICHDYVTTPRILGIAYDRAQTRTCRTIREGDQADVVEITKANGYTGAIARQLVDWEVSSPEAETIQTAQRRRALKL